MMPCSCPHEPILTCDELAGTCTFVPLDHGMVPLVYGQWIADASNSKILSCFMAVVLKYIYRFVSMIVKVKCKVSFLLTFTLIYLSQIMYFWHFHHLTEFQKDHRCLSILIGGDRHAYNRNNVSSNTYFYRMGTIRWNRKSLQL